MHRGSTMFTRLSCVGGATFFALLSFSLQVNASGWMICNKSTKPVDVAISYVATQGGRTSEGWWNLAPCGGCLQVWSGNLPQSDRSGSGIGAFHARSSDRSLVWGDRGNWVRCVDPSRAFTLNDHRQDKSRCLSIKGREWVAMEEVYIKNGDTFTTFLTSSGKTACKPQD